MEKNLVEIRRRVKFIETLTPLCSLFRKAKIGPSGGLWSDFDESSER